MATLASIRTNILSKLADSGGSIAEPTAAQVDAQINSTIDFYTKRTWWFSEAQATGVLADGDATIPVPLDFDSFMQQDAITIQQNQVNYPLLQITPLQYDSMYVGGTGMPRFFVYMDGTIKIYFPANGVYVYFLNYRKTYVDLVEDDDTNDFTAYAARLIEYRTLGDLYLDYRSDAQMAAVYMGTDGEGGRVASELKNIKRQSYNRMATGVLTTENITGRSRSTIFNM